MHIFAMTRQAPVRLRFFAWLLLAGLFSHSEAASGPVAPSGLPFVVDVWDNGDGLPQNSVIAMIQARDGYFWLGTLNGLVRFDGNSFTCFNVNNTPGLPSDRIVFLYEDSRRTLWAGTDGAGLCAISNGVVRILDTGGNSGTIDYASEDETGAVWFVTVEGRFFCWRNGRLDLHPAGLPPEMAVQLFMRSTHMLVPGKAGENWRLQNGQVTQWRGDVLEKNLGGCPWKGEYITAVLSGLPGVTFDQNVKAVAVDHDGNLAVGTLDDGVWFNSAGVWRHLSTEQGLSYRTVLSLYFDHDNNLWVGTDGGGLDRVKMQTFTSPAKLHSGVAQSITADAQGSLWVAFNGGGLSQVETNSATDFHIGVKNNAWSVLVDNRQQVWAGTRDEGLFRLTGQNFESVPEAGGIGQDVFALYQDRAGNLWAGGQDGLGCYDGQNWKIYSAADGLPAGSAVRAITQDAQGNLWIGTEGGLFQLRDGKLSAAPAPVVDISYLLADPGGLWVGTSGHGLVRFQNGTWTACSTLNGGLAADDIGYLVEDDADNLWIGSYEGLLRVEKKSFADFASGAARTVACRTFLARECSAGAQPAAARIADGRLWFPTVQGVVSVNPADLQPDTNPPPVVIESARVDGVEQKTNLLGSAWNAAVTLAPGNEQLEIHFTALSFSAPRGAASGARFKFRLDGRDDDWTDAGSERVAHFNHLAPGLYVFRVTACNEDGVWNDNCAILPIAVQPPFWRKPGFVTLAAAVLLAALAGIIYLISTAKLKRQVRHLQQKELIEQERARIARDLHDQVGANLTQVALLGELAETDKDQPGEVVQHAQQICATARDTTRSLDEIVWSLNPANDTLEGLANYACKYAQDYFALAGIRYRADLPPHLPPAPILPEVRHNVFLAFKEAVNNVVKHAQAGEARVGLRLEPGKFILEVADNGRGAGESPEKQTRNGLKNMRRRLADVRGSFEISPNPGGGTIVRLIVPLAID